MDLLNKYFRCDYSGSELDWRERVARALQLGFSSFVLC